MILVLCQRGNVRSATVATVLRDFYGAISVFASGVETTDEVTLSLLSSVASVILIAGTVDIPEKLRAWNEYYGGKIYRLEEIGRDVWGQPMHPDLVEKAIIGLEDCGAFNDFSHPFYATKEAYMEANRAAYERRIG